MKTSSAFFFAAVAIVFGLTFTRPAWALGPIDIEIAAKVGGATNPLKGGGVNVLGFGLGGRAGVSIFGIYAGITGMYYLGGSETEDTTNGALKVSGSSYLYGVEGGYGLKLSILTLRATIGVGNYTIHSSISGPNLPGTTISTSGSNDTHNVYIEPGATALLGFGMWFVGADAGVFLTPGLDGSKAAFMANGEVGVKF